MSSAFEPGLSLEELKRRNLPNGQTSPTPQEWEALLERLEGLEARVGALAALSREISAQVGSYPTQAQWEHAVDLKLNPLKAAVAGKRVVLVDDSIVRGTTCGKIVSNLRRAGAREVHLRISSPPFTHTCYFGTDIGDEENLIANRLSLSELQARTGADTLGYISLEGLQEACRGSRLPLCYGCFTGEYATQVESSGKGVFESSQLTSFINAPKLPAKLANTSVSPAEDA